MKKFNQEVYRANKSRELFYLQSRDGITVTLRNPMTGLIKEIRGTTLKRSYTKLTEEEVRMESMTMQENMVAIETVEENAVETAVETEKAKVNTVPSVISFEELMQVEQTQQAFKAQLDAVATEEIEALVDNTDLKDCRRLKSNATLTFKENFDRYRVVKVDYEATISALQANDTDLDLLKSAETNAKALQRFTDKMVHYLAVIKQATERIEELKAVDAVDAVEK